MPTNIIIAAAEQRFDAWARRLQNRADLNVLVIRDPEQFRKETIAAFSPRFVFVPQWHTRIPASIYEEFEVVMFHMTELPFGRGGSPLQNLIVRGITETRLTAFRCVEGMDAGPIYTDRPLSLHGTADEIFARCLPLVEEIIDELLDHPVSPVPQEGEVVVFDRRRRNDGDISALGEPERVYDYIRMLDGEGYPPAFIETRGLILEFTDARLDSDAVEAHVIIRRRGEH